MFLYVLAKIRVFSPYCFPLGFFPNRIVPEASNSESCSNFPDSTEGIKAHHAGSDRGKKMIISSVSLSCIEMSTLGMFQRMNDQI